MYTPIYLGGLALPPKWIGIFMATGGLSQAFWLLVLFPPLHKRVGTGGLLKICGFAWPLFFASNPISNILRRNGLDIGFWILFTCGNVFGSSVSMAFSKCLTLLQILENNLIRFSCRATRPQRHLSISREFWYAKRACAGPAVWHSSGRSCCIYVSVCHWRQVSYRLWPSVLDRYRFGGYRVQLHRKNVAGEGPREAEAKDFEQ